MRIIAGEHKGRQIKAPQGRKTRPTVDRVRESLMSMFASARGSVDFEGAVVLDAFAGSGALGLEALSRGAQCVHFFEKRRDAYQVLLDNVTTLGYSGDKAVIHFTDVLSYQFSENLKFNLVFLDPPYALDAGEVFGLIDRVDQLGVLSDDVVVSYEHDPADSDRCDEEVEKSDFEILKRHRYAGVMVNIMKRKGGLG